MTRKPMSSRLRKAVLQQPCCHLCGGVVLQLLGERWVVDHLVPVRWGGTDEPHNLAKAHSTCNAWRSDKKLTPDLLATIRKRRRVELFVEME